MSYIGLDPNTPLLNTSTQFFSGNGAVTQYTLSRAVASSSDLDVIVGNVSQVPGVDYVAGNTTIIFTVAPGSGTNNVAVTYRGGALNSLDLSASVFQAGTVGAPSVYSLASNNAGIYWASANTMGIVVTGANRALFNANVTSVSSVTGAIVTPGGIGVGGNIHIGNQATVNGGVDSTSVSTGTLRVTGGAGITGNLNIGGDITCVGDFTVNGTFTTTGTDSLEVNDPFIFLANANPGDTYDSGVISEYFDGTNTRYTGYFRDITDNTFKFFGNLLPKPGTTVDTANTSYVAANVTVGNISATGNVTASYFVGNGAALTGISTDTTQIQNGNTKVVIPSINGNIVNNVNGVTIANVWSGGISVVGAVAASTTMTATGNITAGNVTTAGQISATGNIAATANVSGGNIVTGGLISATSTITSAANIIGGNIITGGQIISTALPTSISAAGNIVASNFTTSSGLISASGNITGGNIFTAGVVSATGNVTGNYIIGNGSQLTGLPSGYSNANVAAYLPTYTGNLVSLTGPVTTTANVTGGNLITGALAQAVTLSVTGGATFSTDTAEIGIGNSMTSGVIYIGGPSQTGLIQLAQSTASQTVNVATGATGSANTKTINFGTSGAANSQTNINIGTNLGNATVQYTANTIVAMANTGGSALSVAGNVTGGNLRTAGQMSATANVSGGNVISAGLVNAGTTVSAAGNVTGGNIITGGAVSAVGNISATGNVRGGNLTTAGAVSATGNISATGNVTGGNVLTFGVLSATGNVTGGNIVTAGLITATGNITGGNLSGTSIAGTLTTAAQTNITSVGTLSSLTVTANTTSGNLLTGGIVSATGNVIGGNINTAGIMSSTGNAIHGNITTFGLVSATGNVNGGNIISAGQLQAANLIVSGNVSTPSWTTTGVAIRTTASTYTDSSTLAAGTAASNHVNVLAAPTLAGSNIAQTTTLAATLYIAGGPVAGTNMTITNSYALYVAAGNVLAVANISGGNLLTAGIVSSTGNVIGGNINTAGLVTATGNVTGGNILTGGLITATGNITGGNVLTAGVMSATGNITGGNLSGTNITGTLATAAQTNITSVGTLGSLSVTGNITGGNILGGANVNATTHTGTTASLSGNVTGGNIITGGAVSATGNISATANVLGSNVISSALIQGVTVSASGNVIGGNVTTAGLISATGTITTANSASVGGNLTLSGFFTGNVLRPTLDVTDLLLSTSGNANIVLSPAGTGNVNMGRISASGNIFAAALYGNGGPLTGLDATNISTGTLAQARLANSSLTVNGTSIALGGSGTVTATATNALTIGTGLGGTSYNGSAAVTITNTGVLSLANGGGITASASTGAITLGSTATSVNTANAIVARDASGNFSAGTITATLSGAATTAGTVTTAAQPNITSVGTLSSVTVTGNISGGNVLGGANVNATLFTGTTVSVTGNITGGNISTAGNLAAPTAAVNTNTTQVATTAYVLGQLSSSTPAAIAAAGAVGTGTTFARADHTHSGVTSITGTANQVTASASAGAVTLSLPQSIATSSAVQFGSLTVTTGNITLGNVINGGANLSGNIGSATGYFNTVFAKATSAQYADLAETYRADAEYPPGTVLSFGGDFEVTLTTGQNCARVAGVVSTNPAHVMNAGLESEHTAVLALTGRVPASVVGQVNKGDMMVSAGNGQAMSCATPAMGTVIGKALQDHSGESGIIEIVVGRM